LRATAASASDPVNTRTLRSVFLSDVTSAPADPGPARLVVDARAGNADAFGELYQRFARAVHGVLISRVPVDDAEDLVQEVFLHAWPRLGELREPAAFGGWICAIARRRAMDHFRRARPADELEDTHPSADRPDITAEAAAALAAIQTLPEAYRETLALRLVEGLTGPEIAAATGLTPDSVRVNLHRGFKLLRARLGAQP
jgi:RNA polymerase sigma-70 factor, ECF subfamily